MGGGLVATRAGGVGRERGIAECEGRKAREGQRTRARAVGRPSDKRSFALLSGAKDEGGRGGVCVWVRERDKERAHESHPPIEPKVAPTVCCMTNSPGLLAVARS